MGIPYKWGELIPVTYLFSAIYRVITPFRTGFWAHLVVVIMYLTRPEHCMKVWFEVGFMILHTDELLKMTCLLGKSKKWS